MIYPALLLVATMLACFVFFYLILPKFTEVFSQFDITLPLPTRILFGISNFVKNYFIFILGGVIVLGLIAKRLLENPEFEKYLHRTALKLKAIKEFVTLACVERFASTMYILLESGVPIVYTLEVVAKSVGNIVFEEKITAVKENVKRGHALSKELSAIPEMPPLIIEITSIGEEAGNLPEMFKKLSEHYQTELATKIERLVALFEPLMIMVMGIVVGSVVISLFLPLIKLSTAGM